MPSKLGDSHPFATKTPPELLYAPQMLDNTNIWGAEHFGGSFFTIFHKNPVAIVIKFGDNRIGRLPGSFPSAPIWLQEVFDENQFD